MAEWAGSERGVSCTLSFTLMSSTINYTTASVPAPPLTWIEDRERRGYIGGDPPVQVGVTICQ